MPLILDVLRSDRFLRASAIGVRRQAASHLRSLARVLGGVALISSPAPLRYLRGWLPNEADLYVAWSSGVCAVAAASQERALPTIVTTITRLDHTVNEAPHIFTSPGDATPRMSAHDALHAVIASEPYELAARVTATLARMTAPSDAVVPGSRLVWILTAPSVELIPGVGLPTCGSANAMADGSRRCPLGSRRDIVSGTLSLSRR